MMLRTPTRSDGKKNPLWYRAVVWFLSALTLGAVLFFGIVIKQEVARRSDMAKLTPYEQDLWYFSTYTHYRRDPRTGFCFSINPPHGYTYVPCNPDVLKLIEERAD